MTRQTWVLVHRWAGLTMAFFLVVAGLTGSLLAFYDELDAWLNPHWFTVSPPPGQAPLDPYTLRERAEGWVAPRGRVDEVSFAPRAPDAAFQARVKPRIDPATGQPYELGFDQIFLDPYSGALPGTRLWGEVSLAPGNLMPFLYTLHYRLALPGNIGVWLFGIAALIWTLDCFVGFYLTLPRIPGVKRAARFWHNWKPAWQIKWRASATRINFDIHRAAGLWTWPMLLVFAWSAVYFNLGDEVYKPVMKVFFEMRDTQATLPKLAAPRDTPALSIRAAHAAGQRLMATQATRQGFTIQGEERLWYDRERGVYGYSVRSDRDINEHRGGTRILFDGDSGMLKAVELPSGQTSGDTVTGWLTALHMARVFGLPMKIFVCAMGLAVAALTITGIVIWWRKRRAARKEAAARRVDG
ncbi:MAG: PepSY-associated TM helix domain-containing protein [Pseudomonadota bacterium]